jgi:hypothetical protein
VKTVVAAPAPAARSTRQTIAEVDDVVGRGGGVVVWPPARPVRGVLESALSRGRTLVVCPGVGTARTIATALRREGLTVALMPDDWQRAAEGVDVVVGARSTVWAPCPGSRRTRRTPARGTQSNLARPRHCNRTCPSGRRSLSHRVAVANRVRNALGRPFAHRRSGSPGR